MTNKTVMDPFAMWKSMYDQTEKNLNEVIHETIKTEAFSEWLGQVQSSYLQYQQLVHKTADEYLKQINMPTRDEIASLASLIINVEEKIDNLDQRFDDELLESNAKSEINRLKATVTKLDKKLDQVVALLEKLQHTPKVPASTNDK